MAFHVFDTWQYIKKKIKKKLYKNNTIFLKKIEKKKRSGWPVWLVHEGGSATPWANLPKKN
jgi:hypothetical protein